MGTALGRVHALPSPHKIVVGKVALGQVSSNYFAFSLSMSVSYCSKLPITEQTRKAWGLPTKALLCRKSRKMKKGEYFHC